ncbi:hypothetical protein BDQ17DRAFT_1391484 [Cyathus striatus]|nr:hypothetical protein BDQ17DRAFT_1391484 [Cyathus striatus]
MGKLNIAHHKSYHPYRRDNIERVRRDEEEARLKEEAEEGRMQLADSEARIELLRERAGLTASSNKKKKVKDDVELDKQLAAGRAGKSIEETSSSGTGEQGLGPVLPTTNGHINFFEDLEHTTLIQASLASKRKPAVKETEKGVALAPDKKDLNPWYSTRSRDPAEEKLGEEEEEKRKRDSLRKSTHDPLTSITKQLSSRSPQNPTQHSNAPPYPSRLARESSERERALALIRRKQKEQQGRGNETPSTVHGGEDPEEYGDVYNRREVEDARRERERHFGGRSYGRDDRRDRGGWGDRRRGSLDEGRMNRDRGGGSGWGDARRSFENGGERPYGRQERGW